MVSMGVTAVLLAFMLSTVVQLLGVWERATGSLSTRAQADLILDRVSQDLQAAILRKDGKVWFAATVQSSPQAALGDAAMSDAVWNGRVKPSSENPGAPGSSLNLEPVSGSLEDFRFGQAGVWLRFFTTQPDTQNSLNNLSAPRAVAYQMVRRHITSSASSASPSTAPIRYALYRSSARPMSPSWPDGNSTFAAGFDLFSEAAAVDYTLADSSQIDQVGNIRSPRRYEQIVGNNVIDFGVRCWIRDENGALAIGFPRRTGLPAGNSNRGFAASLRDGVWAAPVSPPSHGAFAPPALERMTFGFPERIDVLVRILTDEGARILEAFELGRTSRPPETSSDDEHWWNLALAHSHAFTQQIPIRAHAQ